MDKDKVKLNSSYYKYSESGIKIRNFDLWETVVNFINIEIPFKEKFFLFENNIDSVPTCYCGSKLRFIDMNSGFRKFCSKKCAVDSDELKKNRKLTCLEKYGVDNPSKSSKIKDKVKKTNLEKFGVEFPLQSEEILNRTKNNFLNKFGVDNPSKIKEVREKAKLTNLEKFGVEHAMQNNDVKLSFVKFFIEKHGVDNPSKIEEVKEKRIETMLHRHGSEHPLHLDKFREKSKKTNLEKYGHEFYTQSDQYKESMKEFVFEKNSKLINDEKCELIEVNNSEFKVKCYRCLNEFFINRQLWRSRSRIGEDFCLKCNPINNGTSKGEKEILNFIKKEYSGEVLENYKLKKEIDIYLPDLNLGFEYNGLYWHSELNKSKRYHIDKHKYFEKIGIRVVSLWEDDWLFKNDIVKSIIKNRIGLSDKKIFARKCKIKELNDVKDNIIIREFLEKNHMQGFVGSKIRIGLFYNQELVSLMTFGELRKSLGQKKESGAFEMLRFCNTLDTVVIGGASKIFDYFLKKYVPVKVISFSDNSRSNGHMYEKLGFDLESESVGNYFWYKDLSKFHRFNFRKDKLVKMGFDKNKTEVEIMHEQGYYRIWDCGQKKWIYDNKKNHT